MNFLSVFALAVAFSTAPLAVSSTFASQAAPQIEQMSPPKKETMSDREYSKRRAKCISRAKAMKFGVHFIKRTRFINRCMDGKA